MKYRIMPLDDEDAEYISEKLNGYVRSAVMPGPGAEEEKVILKIEDDSGTVIAGCAVRLRTWNWDRMLIAALWVDERYRRLGLGSKLIREAERLGREKGCYISCLGTLSFQARGLYEKHGYTVFTVNKDFPRGYEGYSMAKRLDRNIQDHIPENNGAGSRFRIQRGTSKDEEIIYEGLGRHNDAFAPDLHDEIPVCRKLVDEDGRFIAGILAEIGSWDDFDVDVLWVEEPYRHKGLGSYLLREAENEAVENGACKLFASAGDWNVGFFKKNGYTVNGELKDVPKGHSCYELEKKA